MSSIKIDRSSAINKLNDFYRNRAYNNALQDLAYRTSTPYGVSRIDDEINILPGDAEYLQESLDDYNKLTEYTQLQLGISKDNAKSIWSESLDFIEDSAKWLGDAVRTLGKRITDTIFSANEHDLQDLKLEKEVLDIINGYKTAVSREGLVRSNLIESLQKNGFLNENGVQPNDLELSDIVNNIKGIIPMDLSKAIDEYKRIQSTINEGDRFFKTDGRQYPVVQELMYHGAEGLKDNLRVGLESATESFDREDEYRDNPDEKWYETAGRVGKKLFHSIDDQHLLGTVAGVLNTPISAVLNTLTGQNKNVAVSKLANGDPLIDRLYSGRAAFENSDSDEKVRDLYRKNQRLTNQAHIKTMADLEFYTTGIIHPSVVAKTLAGKLDMFDQFNDYTDLNKSDLTGEWNSFKFYDPNTISKEYEKAQQEGSGTWYRPDLWFPEVGSTLGLILGMIGSSTANSVANLFSKKLALSTLNPEGRVFAALKSAIIAADVTAGLNFAKLSRVDETAGEAISGQSERIVNMLNSRGVPFQQTMEELKESLLHFGYSKKQLDSLTPDKLVSLGIAYNIKTNDGAFDQAVYESRKGLNELINANNSLAYMDYLGCYLPFTSYGGSMMKAFANKLATSGENITSKLAISPIRILTGEENIANASRTMTLSDRAAERLYSHSVTDYTPRIGSVLDDIAVPIAQKAFPTVTAVFDHLGERAATRFANKQLPKLALWTKHLTDFGEEFGGRMLDIGIIEGVEEGNQEILQIRYKKGKYDDIKSPYTIFSLPEVLKDVDLSFLTMSALFGLDNEFTGQERDQIRHATAVGFLASTVLPIVGATVKSVDSRFDDSGVSFGKLFRQLASDAQASKVISRDLKAALNKLFLDNKVIQQINALEQQDIQDWQHANLFFDAMHKRGVSREKIQKSLIDYIDILNTANKGKQQSDQTLISKQFIRQDIDLLNAVATLYDSPFIKDIVKENKWTMYGEEHKQAVLDGATQLVGAAIHDKVASDTFKQYRGSIVGRNKLLNEYFDPSTTDERKQQILDNSPFMSAFINHVTNLFNSTLSKESSYEEFSDNLTIKSYAESILKSRLARPETSVNPARSNEDDVTKQQWTLEDILKEEFDKKQSDHESYFSKLKNDTKYQHQYAQQTLLLLHNYKEMLAMLKVLDFVQDLEKWQKELNSLTGLDTNVKDLHGAVTYLKKSLEEAKKKEKEIFSKQSSTKDITYEKLFKDLYEFDDEEEVNKLLFGWLLNFSANQSQQTVRNAYLTKTSLYGKHTPKASDLNDSLYGEEESPLTDLLNDYNQKKLELEELSKIDEKAAKAMIVARVKEKQRRNKIAHQIYEQERGLTTDDIDKAEDGDQQAAERVLDHVAQSEQQLNGQEEIPQEQQEQSMFGNGGLFQENLVDTMSRHTENGTTSHDDAIAATLENALNAKQDAELKDNQTAAEEHNEEQEKHPASTEAQPGPAPVIENHSAEEPETPQQPAASPTQETPVQNGPVAEGSNSRAQEVSIPEEVANTDVSTLIEQALSDRKSRTQEQNERRKKRKESSKQFGSENKIVTQKQKNKATDYIKKFLTGNTNGMRYLDERNTFVLPSVLPVDLVAAMSDLALFVIEAGSRKFGDFVHEMYDQLRDNGVSHEDIMSMQGNPEINFKSLYTTASTRYVNGVEPEQPKEPTESSEKEKKDEKEKKRLEEKWEQLEEKWEQLLKEQAEREKEEEERKRREQELSNNEGSAELSLLDAIGKMDMDEDGNLIIEGAKASNKAQANILSELEFILSAEYSSIGTLIEEANKKGDSDSRFATTKHLISNYISRTFFYDPKATDTVDLSIDGKEIKLNKPLAPNSQLAEKLLDHNWLKNANKYYVVGRRKAVFDDETSRNNPDCFDVMMIIEDDNNSYAVFLRPLGSYMSYDKSGRTYTVNNEQERRDKLSKIGTVFENEDVLTANGHLHEVALLIAEEVYASFGNPKPDKELERGVETEESKRRMSKWKALAHKWYEQGPSDKKLIPEWKKAVATIKEMARQRSAKKNVDILTNELIEDQIQKLRENRNQIIDAVLTKDTEGNYIFPDASKPFPQTAHPKNYNQSNGRFDNQEENGVHTFRPIQKGSVVEIQQRLDDGTVVVGMGLGFFSKTNPGLFVIRTMGDDATQLDGKGYSGKLYWMVDTPTGGKAALMLSEEKFDIQERANGDKIQANSNARVVLDMAGNNTDNRYKTSAAEALLHLICGVVSNNDPIFNGDLNLANLFATFFVNNGEATIIEGHNSKSKLFKSKIAAFAQKQIYWDEEKQQLQIAMPQPDGTYHVEYYDKAEIFADTDEAKQLKTKIVKAIASQMHWNTEENHMTSKFSDGQFAEMMDALKRYFIQTGEQSVDILGCPQLSFRKDDLFDGEMNIRKGITVLSWMIKTMRIKTDVSDKIFYAPFVFADGIEQSPIKEVVHEAQGANKQKPEQNTEISIIAAQEEKLKSIRRISALDELKLAEGTEKQSILSHYGKSMMANGRKVKDVLVMDISDIIDQDGNKVFDEIKKRLIEKYGKDKVNFSNVDKLLISLLGISPRLAKKRGDNRKKVPQVIVYEDGSVDVTIEDASNVIDSGVTGVASTEKRGKLDEKKARAWLKKTLGIDDANIIVSNAILKSMSGEEVYGLTCLSVDALNGELTGDIQLSRNFGSDLQYHEAWHYVNLLMHNASDRAIIYHEYCRIHPEYKDRPYEEIEECIANEFMAYMTMRDSYSPIKLLKRLFDNIKTFLKIGNNRATYRAIFEAIRKGDYATVKLDEASIREFLKRYPLGAAYDGYIQNVPEEVLRNMIHIKTYHDFYNTAEAIINKLMIDLNIKTIRDIRRICGKDFKDLLKSIEILANKQTSIAARDMIMDFVNNPLAFQKALIAHMAQYGIKAKIKSFKKEKQDDLQDPNQEHVDELDKLNEKPEEERGLEYDKFDLEEPKKSNAAIETKLFMSRVPVYKRKVRDDGGFDYERVKDRFGLDKYFTFGEVWTSLLEVFHNCDSFDKRGTDGNYLPNSIMGLCERQALSSVMFVAVLEMFNDVIKHENEGFYIQLKQMLSTTFNSSKPKVLYILLSDPKNIQSNIELDLLVASLTDMFGSGQETEAAYKTVSDKDRVWELFNDSRFDIIRSVPRRWSQNALLNDLSTIDKYGNISVNPTFVYNILKQLGYQFDDNGAILSQGDFLIGKGSLQKLKMQDPNNDDYSQNGILTNINILLKLQKSKAVNTQEVQDQIADVVDELTDQLIKLLNSMGITMDEEVLNAYVMMDLKVRSKNLTYTHRANAYKNLMKTASSKKGGSIMDIVRLLVKSVNQQLFNTGQQDGKPIEELYNRFGMNTDIAKLALANNAAHPSKQEFSVRGANGDMLYPISQNNFISDIVRWLNNEEGLSNDQGLSEDLLSYARKLSKSSYAQNSLVLSLAKRLDGTSTEDRIQLLAFVGMKDMNTGEGADYLGITPMEDYLSKMFILESDHLTKADVKKRKNGEEVVKIGLIVLPIMSDKKTYYSIGSTALTLCHDLIYNTPSNQAVEDAKEELYISTLNGDIDAIDAFENLAGYEKRTKLDLWYDTLTQELRLDVQHRSVEILNERYTRMNTFSLFTLDRFAGYFADEIQSLIDYYDEKNIKSLVNNPLQLIENFHGKVKDGRLQFGGNGGLFRYFYDVARYTDKNGYVYNMNQRLEWLWNLLKLIEEGKVKLENIDLDDQIKNVSKLILGKSRNLDGFELIRAYLQSVKKFYFNSNRNAKYAPKQNVYDSINGMLIRSVKEEMRQVASDPSLEMIQIAPNGMYIPDKIPNQFLNLYLDDMLAVDPGMNRNDADVISNATFSLFASNTVNNLISIIEYEKIFCGDPALYKAKGLKSIIDHEGVEQKKRIINDTFKLNGETITTFQCQVNTVWDKFSDKIKRHGGQLSPGEELTLFYNREEIEYDLLCERPSYLSTTKYTNLHVEDLMGTSAFLKQIRTNFLRQCVVDFVRNGDEKTTEAFNKFLEKHNKKSEKKTSKENLIDLIYARDNVFYELYNSLPSDIVKEVNSLVNQQIKPYTDITVSDAQVIVRPSMYRKIRIGLGQWSFEPDPNDPTGYCDEDAYNTLMDNPEWLTDEKKGNLVRRLELFPLKMSYFQNDPTVVGTQNINLAIYGKQAIFPLFEFNARTSVAKQVYDRMNRSGDEIDMISFKSAIKVGGTMNAVNLLEEDDLARYVYIQTYAFGKTAKEIIEDYSKSLQKKGMDEDKADAKAKKDLSNKNQKELLDEYEQQLNDQMSKLTDEIERLSDNYIQYTDDKLNALDIPTVNTRKEGNLLHTTIQDLKFLRMQLNTRAHNAEERSIGSQMFKIAFSNIYDDENYGIGKEGQLKKGSYLKDDLMACINALTKIGAEDIKSRYYKTVGNKSIPNKNAVRRWILRVIENNGLGSSAAEIIANGGTISSLMSRTLFEQTVCKSVGDSVVKINSNGGTAVQLSSFGFGNYAPNMNTGENIQTPGELDYGVLNNGNEIKWSSDGGAQEVILSANYFKAIVPEEHKHTHKEMRQWLIDNDYINGTKSNGTKSHPKAIGVGYRIPTLGMSSMFVFICADILPETSGDTIIVPKEFTGQTGSDFDVDKLYLALLACDKEGKPYEIPKINDFNWANCREVWRKVAQSIKSENNGAYAASLALTDEEYMLLHSDWNNLSQEEIDSINEYINKNYSRFVSDFRKQIVGDVKDITKLSRKLKEAYFSLQNEKAVLNMLIKDYMTIISDVKNYAVSRASIDTMTNTIKDNLLPYVQEKHTDYIPSFTELLPSFQSRKKMEFSSGKDGIAPFALAITNLAQTQYTHLSMSYVGSNGEDYGKLYNLGELDKIQGKDGLRISDWLSAMVNAHVDVAKDPYVFAINVNKITYNLTCFLIRAGRGLSTFTFLSQPILKEFTARAMQRNSMYGGNLDGKKSAGDRSAVTKYKVANLEIKKLLGEIQIYYDQVKDLKDENGQSFLSDADIKAYNNIISYFSYRIADKKPEDAKKPKLEAETLRYVDVFDVKEGLAAIENYVKKSNNEEDIKATYKSKIFLIMSLYAYEVLDEYALKLSDLVHNSLIDTQKYGNTIMEHVNFENSMSIFINKSEGWKITNNENLDSTQALNYYFNDLYLMDKFKTSTEMTREILRDWTFTANPGVIKLFKGICGSLFGEETVPELDDKGKPNGKVRVIGYKDQKDTELIDLLASCIDNAIRHNVLFNASKDVRDKQNNPLLLEDKYGPIDFTMGGGLIGIVRSMRKLAGLIYGDPESREGRNIFLRLSNFITYIKSHPKDDRVKHLIEDGQIINELLLQLHPEQATKNRSIGKISLLNSQMNMTVDYKQVLSSAFYELLNNPDDDIRELARDLIFYSYYTDYNQNTRDGIFDLVPYTYRQQYDKAISLGIKDRKYITGLDDSILKEAGGYNAAIRRGMSGGISIIDRYIAIISRNYWYNDKIVPRYFDTKNRYQTISQNGRTIYSNYYTPRDSNSEFPGLIMSSRLTTFDGREAPPYFKIKKGSTTILYQNIGSISVPKLTKKGVSYTLYGIWVPVQKAGVHEAGINCKEMYCDFETPSIYEVNKLPEAWSRQTLIEQVKKFVDIYNNDKNTTLPINFNEELDIMRAPQMYDLVTDGEGTLNNFIYYETDSQQSLNRDDVEIAPVKTKSLNITDDVVGQSSVVIEIGTDTASTSKKAQFSDNVIHIDSIKDIDKVYDKLFEIITRKGSVMSKENRGLIKEFIPETWSTVLSEGVNIGIVGESSDPNLNNEICMFVQNLVSNGLKLHHVLSCSNGKSHSIADAVAAASEYAGVKSKIFVPKNMLRSMTTTHELPQVLGDILYSAEQAIKDIEADEQKQGIRNIGKGMEEKYSQLYSELSTAQMLLREAAAMPSDNGTTADEQQAIAEEIQEEAASPEITGGLFGMTADIPVDMVSDTAQSDEDAKAKPKGGLTDATVDNLTDINPIIEC